MRPKDSFPGIARPAKEKTFDPATPLQGREAAAAAWTGKRIIIWSGYVPGRGGVTAKA
jgi:hypothetical protein